MEPIINPWMIYFAAVSDEFKKSCLSASIVSAAVLVGFIIMMCANMGEYGKKDIVIQTKRWIKQLIIVCAILFAIVTVTPSSEIIYAMTITRNVTPNNIEIFGNNTKEVVDYIFEKINEVTE